MKCFVSESGEARTYSWKDSSGITRREAGVSEEMEKDKTGRSVGGLRALNGAVPVNLIPPGAKLWRFSPSRRPRFDC